MPLPSRAPSARERAAIAWERWIGSVPLAALALSLLTLVLGGITVNLLTGSVFLDGLVPGPDVHPRKTLAAVVAAFVACACALFHKRGDFQAVRTLAQQPARGRRGLVLLLSPPNIRLEALDGGGFRVGRATLTGTDLLADIEALGVVRWSWQQLLRALRPHAQTLRHVYLIGSRDTAGPTAADGYPGSYVALAEAERLVRAYVPPEATVHRVRCAVDFQSLRDLQECVADAVSLLLDRGVRKEDIVVDVTGGQKTASIAGALITLSSNVTFQYVQTNWPFDTLEYDLEIRSSSLV